MPKFDRVCPALFPRDGISRLTRRKPMKRNPPRQLTWIPQVAIQAHCLWCCEDRKKEVLTCASAKCPLHPFRTGEVISKNFDPLAIIRKKCLDCVMGLHSEVESCSSVRCSLWLFRLGVGNGKKSERDTCRRNKKIKAPWSLAPYRLNADAEHVLGKVEGVNRG